MINAQHPLWRERYLAEDRADHLNFSSNDYLAIRHDPRVKKAFIEGVERYGLGSGSAMLVNGYHRAHQMLEEAFAEFLQRDRCLLFNSGYHANLGVITTFAHRHTTVASDKWCHASLLDAIQLSRAKYKRFAHAQPNTLSETLPPNSLIVSESVFSMQGDICPTDELTRLARTAHSTLVLDDAHGVGVLGENGRGIVEYKNLNQRDVPVLISPLGKALGSMGAIVSGTQDMIETLIQNARSFRYTTALAPAIAHATCTALKLVQDKSRREKLRANIAFFNATTQAYALPLLSTDETPIRSILIGCSMRAQLIQDACLRAGLNVVCMRPPTVPANRACLRISLSCGHSQSDMLKLLNSLQTEIRRTP